MTLTSTLVSFLHLPKRAVWRWTLLAVLPLVILLGLNRWSAKGAWALVPSKAPQVNFTASLQLAYYNQDNDWDSTVVLNNNAKEDLYVLVTLYGKNGQLLNVPLFSLKANSIRRFKITDWTLGANDFREGNINVAFNGKPMQITGQVSVVNHRDRLEFESKPSMAMDYSSQRLNGIVTLPNRQAKAYVALTNTSGNPIEVSLNSDSEHVHSDKVKLSAHETKVEEIKLKNGNNSPLSVLLTLQHNGAVGALITTAYATNKQTGYTANLYFYDDAKTVSNKLVGVHFRFGDANPTEGFPAGTVFKAPLVLANLGNASSTATVTVDYTQNGEVKTQSIGSFTLPSRGVKDIELQSALANVGVTGPVEDASVEIKYTGTAGTLVGQLTSMSTNGDYTFDVPMKDPLMSMNSTSGSYPFRLDGGYNTVLHLKNLTDKKVRAIVQIRYEGGTYHPDQITLEPHQTLALDIKKLQSQQTIDIRSGVLPANVASGKVIWSERDPLTVVGRAETANIGEGIAGSFSCPWCSCDPHTSTFWVDYISPFNGYSAIGDEGFPIRGYELLASCDDIEGWGPYWVSGYTATWSSTDSSVASVAADGYVSCLAPGTTDIYMRYTAISDRDNNSPSCTATYSEFVSHVTINIIRLTILKGSQNVTNGSMDVIVGQKIGLEVRPDPAAYNFSNIQWTVPGTKVANYNPTTSSAVPTDLTVLNQATINYYWVDGGNNRQVSVSANIGGKTYTASTTFNVKRPIVQNIDATTGTIAADSNFNKPGTHLHFGNPNTTSGIVFSATVQKPSGFTGDLAWVQVAHPVLRRYKENLFGNWEKLDETGLDTDFPYAGPYSGNTVSTSDSPGGELTSGYQRVEIADRYSMWLIFKPSGTDSIWVPLSRVDWGWNGVAIRSGAFWALDSASIEGIAVADDLSFPRWLKAIDINNWVSGY